jgi:hypothetical protein
MNRDSVRILFRNAFCFSMTSPLISVFHIKKDSPLENIASLLQNILRSFKSQDAGPYDLIHHNLLEFLKLSLLTALLERF